jgi:HprK-related kinase B
MIREKRTVRGLGDDLLAETPPASSFSLRIADFVVRVESNSSSLVSVLERYYRGFAAGEASPDAVVIALERETLDPGLPLRVMPREQGKSGAKEAYADVEDGRLVRKLRTGMVFLLGEGLNMAVGPCEANVNQVVNFINNRFMEHRVAKGDLLLHAAGVVCRERGLIISGFSGAGKSTLSLHCVRRGFGFVSNDRVLVTRRRPLRMYGVPKYPRVNPGTIVHHPDLKSVLPEEQLERYLTMPSDQLWELESKHDIFIDELFGPDRFILSAPAEALIVLSWQRGAGSPPRLDEVDIEMRGDLLPAFTKSLGVFYRGFDGPGGGEVDSAYVQALKGCRVLEITGGVDFDRAARLLTDLVGRTEGAGPGPPAEG